ncbi:hypothetical protein GGX14DRAFT_399677 [Mycena pura]|uniref:Uncharacterized protein n=1 Tax=Mycena pura TaxID=153505 RepID=A0AAD6V7S0_9AGAR|nr:hypothetical protein GGX14DRAFT_399677 [Mycena pura]
MHIHSGGADERMPSCRWSLRHNLRGHVHVHKSRLGQLPVSAAAGKVGYIALSFFWEIVGMTNEPPPSIQALTQMQVFFDGRYFDPAQQQSSSSGPSGTRSGAHTALSTQQRPSRTVFDYSFTKPAADGQGATKGKMAFDRTVDTEHFLATLRRNMALPDDAPVGWKPSDDAKLALAHPLAMRDDVRAATEQVCGIKENPRHQKDVFLKVIDLQPKAQVCGEDLVFLLTSIRRHRTKEPKETELPSAKHMAATAASR